MDVIDAAQDIEALGRDTAIDQARAALAAPGHRDCVGCGEEIGEARLAALPSASRCVDCQASIEHRARRTRIL